MVVFHGLFIWYYGHYIHFRTSRQRCLDHNQHRLILVMQQDTYLLTTRASELAKPV